MGLSNLRRPPTMKKRRKRVGRGIGSGHGGTAGRGHKGQLSRSGVSRSAGFEGGQMPLQRRLPKRGFKNYCRETVAIVHVKDLAQFEENAVVDPQALCRAGLIRRETDRVKILSDGDLGKKLTVRAQGFSQKAREKIEGAGGQAEIISQVRRSSQSTPSKEG